MISQSISLNPKLNQSLKLSPLVLQQLKLLQLSQVELLGEIEAELEQNPLLEKDEVQELSAEDFSSYFKSVKGERASFEKEPEDYEPSISYLPTLSEHLLSQLPFLVIPEQEIVACRVIIGNLDERGYLGADLEELSEHFQIPFERMLSSLKSIQSLDPRGVGARSLEECLAIQIEGHPEFALLEKMICVHLQDIAYNRLKAVTKDLGVSMAKLDTLLQTLRSLDPKPGLQYESESHISTEYIVPDIYIELADDSLSVKSPDPLVPRLSINEHYRKLLEDDSNPESKKYLAEKLNRAIFLIKNIEQRKNTLLAVTESIASFQRDFLLGKSDLLPLNMKDISDMLGLHESTVSRAVKGKYVSSPAGIFPLKFFFSSKKLTSDTSSSELKSRISALISEENPKKPYSDQKLSEILASEGFSVARRTVAKYREKLGISSSSLRKVHN